MMTAVVAVRKGSQRVPNKNVKEFGDTNLLEMKLNVLKKVSGIDKIVVNSDCDEMLEVGKKFGVDTHKREEYYASSECSNSEFHKHIGETTEGDTIFLAPVCSPFVSVESHEKGIEYYNDTKYDSVTSVSTIKNHLWLDNKPLNYDLDNVPNSQDLPNVLKLNYGMTIIDRKTMIEKKGVVGNKPGFYNLNEVESIDIDTHFDFFIAELVYYKLKGEGLLC